MVFMLRFGKGKVVSGGWRNKGWGIRRRVCLCGRTSERVHCCIETVQLSTLSGFCVDEIEGRNCERYVVASMVACRSHTSPAVLV